MDHLADTRLAFGLSEQIVDSLRQVFARYPKVDKALIYGSRATGSHRPHSDIDIAVMAPSMDNSEFARLWNDLDDLPIVFRLDVLHFERAGNPQLRQNILEKAVVLYPTGIENSES